MLQGDTIVLHSNNMLTQFVCLVVLLAVPGHTGKAMELWVIVPIVHL